MDIFYLHYDPLELLRWAISLDDAYRRSQSSTFYSQNMKYIIRETALSNKVDSTSTEYFNRSPYKQPNFTDVTSDISESNYMKSLMEIYRSIPEIDHSTSSLLEDMYRRYQIHSVESGYIQMNMVENEVIVERVQLNINQREGTYSGAIYVSNTLDKIYMNDYLNCNTESTQFVNLFPDISDSYRVLMSKTYKGNVFEEKIKYTLFIKKEILYLFGLNRHDASVFMSYFKFNSFPISSDITEMMITTIHGKILYHYRRTNRREKGYIHASNLEPFLRLVSKTREKIVDESMVLKSLEYSKESGNYDEMIRFIRSEFNYYPFNIYSLGVFNIRETTVRNTMTFITCLSRIYKKLIRLRDIEPIQTPFKEIDRSEAHRIIFTILIPDSNQLDDEIERCKSTLSKEYKFIGKLKRGDLYYKYILTYGVIFSQNNPSEILDKESINSIFHTFHDMMMMDEEFYTGIIKKLILRDFV